MRERSDVQSVDSPVGVRRLANDVLVSSQQGQSVLAEIHSHGAVPAIIQTGVKP